MVTLFSIGVWLFTLVVALRVLRDCGDTSTTRRAPRWTWLLLLLGAIPLLGRPHELLLSGQDPGVYLNAAGAFHRYDSVFYVDPMLDQVPLETRYDFMFGHIGYGLTKDSCLELKDWQQAFTGPRFPALFPILLSPLIATGIPPLALWITPLFALLTALVLWVLMERLLQHRWAGAVAATCYLATPLLIWHARAPRPELVASFFSLAGFALLLRAWRAPPWRRWPDLVLGACCVALAPSFHITAWFMASGAALVMVGWLARGRADGLLYPPLALAGLGAYAWQVVAIGDQYQLSRFILPQLAHPARLGVGIGCLLLAPPLAFLVWRRLARSHAGAALCTWAMRPVTIRLTGGMAALALIAACTAVYRAHPPLAGRVFGGTTYHYLHPVDLPYTLLMLGLPVVALALAGLLLMLLDPRREDLAPRLAWLVWMLPGALLVGLMHDLFMTRYLTPYFLPLIASGVAALLTALAPAQAPAPGGGIRRGRKRLACLALATVVLVAHPLRDRFLLLTTTEYRGLARTLDAIAAPVRATDGMLLVEYARFGAPLEHLYGLPVLSLDNETRLDYRAALRAWGGLMARQPERPAYFLTPYPAPRSEHFQFTPVQSNTVAFTRLSTDRFRLPKAAAATPIDLVLYRMTPAPPPATPLPHAQGFDPGNMGRAGFQRLGKSAWTLEGALLTTGVTTRVPLATPLDVHPGDHLLLFMHVQDAGADTPPAVHPRPAADSASHFTATRWTPLLAGWHVLQLTASATASVSQLQLRTEGPDAATAELWHLRGGAATAVPLAPVAHTPHKVGLHTRAAFTPCAWLAAQPPTGTTAVAAVLMAPAASTAHEAWQLLDNTGSGLGTRTPPADRWSWQVWSLPTPAADAPPPPVHGWLTLSTTRPLALPDSIAPAARLSQVAVFATTDQ